MLLPCLCSKGLLLHSCQTGAGGRIAAALAVPRATRYGWGRCVGRSLFVGLFGRLGRSGRIATRDNHLTRVTLCPGRQKVPQPLACTLPAGRRGGGCGGGSSPFLLGERQWSRRKGASFPEPMGGNPVRAVGQGQPWDAVAAACVVPLEDGQALGRPTRSLPPAPRLPGDEWLPWVPPVLPVCSSRGVTACCDALFQPVLRLPHRSSRVAHACGSPGGLIPPSEARHPFAVFLTLTPNKHRA